MNIRFTVRPDPASQRNLVAALSRVPDEIAKEVMPLCEDHVREGFANVFTLEGPGWRRLKKRTLDIKRRAGLPLKILQRSGMLEDSLTFTSNPWHVCRRVQRGLGDWYSLITSRHPLFLIHTEGVWASGRPSLNRPEGATWIPKRPMAHMTGSDVMEMDRQARATADRVVKHLSGAR